jgi:Flp pilus assembly protein TadG
MAPIRLQRLTTEQEGAALVEFALVAPLLLVIVAGIVDFGFLFQRYEVVTNAAREGARLGSLPGYVTCAATNPGTTAATAAAVDTRVRAYVQQGLALTTAQMTGVMPTGAVVVTCPTMAVPIPSGTTNVRLVSVEVTYTHNFMMLGPMLALINGSWGNTMNVIGRSQMRLEAGAAAGS